MTNGPIESHNFEHLCEIWAFFEPVFLYKRFIHSIFSFCGDGWRVWILYERYPAGVDFDISFVKEKTAGKIDKQVNLDTVMDISVRRTLYFIYFMGWSFLENPPKCVIIMTFRAWSPHRRLSTGHFYQWSVLGGPASSFPVTVVAGLRRLNPSTWVRFYHKNKITFFFFLRGEKIWGEKSLGDI